jgi:NAD(P)H-hydrate epimerase
MFKNVNNYASPMQINLKPRKKTSHKGENGKILIIGGSEDYIGAPALVGMAAMAVLRSGADLVTVAAPEKVAWAINCISPDIITKKIKCKNFSQKNVKEVLSLSKNVDVVEIGNGIAFTPGAKEFMQQIIKRLNGKKPLIIDAAALRVIRIQDVKNSVLLPHAGELKKLLKNSGLTEKSLQKNLSSNILVKKGHPKTAIMSKNKLAYNSTGNAGMTHGGTGDVLAGITAALIAQGNDPFMSAYAAAYINGNAADILYKKMGFGYLASDLVKTMPLILKKFQRQI